MTLDLTHRTFLRAGGSALALSLLNLRFTRTSHAASGAGATRYETFADIYRERWTWDHVAKGTHYVNCGDQRGYAWNVHAKDGIVWREEQIGDYHGWEPFQFKGKKSHQALIPSPLNPIQLAGGYFHLQPMVLMQSPGCTDRGTRVEVESAKSA